MIWVAIVIETCVKATPFASATASAPDAIGFLFLDAGVQAPFGPWMCHACVVLGGSPQTTNQPVTLLPFCLRYATPWGPPVFAGVSWMAAMRVGGFRGPPAVAIVAVTATMTASRMTSLATLIEPPSRSTPRSGGSTN